MKDLNVSHPSHNVASHSKKSLAAPVKSLLQTFVYLISGRFHFKKRNLGKVVHGDDGIDYTIFREVVIEPARGQAQTQPQAVFVLRFQVTNLSPKLNQTLSLLPIPFYAGFSGFLSKVYTINQTHCQSIYEFDTVQNAEAYSQSMALQFITRRSVPGSVSFKIVPQI